MTRRIVSVGGVGEDGREDCGGRLEGRGYLCEPSSGVWLQQAQLVEEKSEVRRRGEEKLGVLAEFGGAGGHGRDIDRPGVLRGSNGIL